jgi:hypothetical protein
MKKILRFILLAFLVSIKISAQQSSFQDTLLEKMTGSWILKGSIAGQEVTHDIEVSWILEHQYLQISEISREKDPDGTAAYEAMVLIGWDSDSSKYACLWLDVTGGGGISAQAVIGYAERDEDKIPFLFKMNEESIWHTTFAYDRITDTWQWNMDGEENGKFKPFARVKLTRKD